MPYPILLLGLAAPDARQHADEIFDLLLFDDEVAGQLALAEGEGCGRVRVGWGRLRIGVRRGSGRGLGRVFRYFGELWDGSGNVGGRDCG